MALKCRESFGNKWNNKGVEIIEQIGRILISYKNAKC